MKTQLTYSEFKTRRQAFQATRPAYAKGIESNEDGVTELAYKMYLKGRIPAYANN